jgi:hypothetical protein
MSKVKNREQKELTIACQCTPCNTHESSSVSDQMSWAVAKLIITNTLCRQSVEYMSATFLDSASYAWSESCVYHISYIAVYCNALCLAWQVARRAVAREGQQKF